MVKKGEFYFGVLMGGGGIILLILVFLYMNSGKVKENFIIMSDNGKSKPFQECVDTCKKIGYSVNDRTNNTCRNVCFALGNGFCNSNAATGLSFKSSCASDVLKKYADDKTHEFYINDREASPRNAITYYDINNKLRTSTHLDKDTTKACPKNLNPKITKGDWGPITMICV